MKRNLDAETIKKAYRNRWRRYLGGTVIGVIALFVYIPQIPPGAAVPHSPVGVGAGLVMLAFGIFSVCDWRCPVCNGYLSKLVNFRCCPRCGVQLRD